MSVNTGLFTKSLKGAGAHLKAFGDDIGGAQSKIAGFGSAIAGTAVVAGLVALTKSSMESVSATAKLADSVGTSTESLVGLQHAAGLSGTDAGMLGEQLGKLNNQLANAATAGGPAADALAKIGLDAKTLASGDVIDSFGQIADGLNKITNPAERAQAAVGIFGEEGLKMSTLLSQGSEGIAKATAEAEKLGITFSRVDASKVEDANRALSKVGDVFVGIGNQIAIGISPYLDALVSKLLEFQGEAHRVGGGVSGSMEMVANSIGVTADVLHTVTLGWKWLQAASSTAIAYVLENLSKLAKGITGIINLIPGMNVTFTDSLDIWAGGIRELADSQFKDFNTALQAEPPSTGIKNFFTEIRASAEATTKAVTKSGDGLKAFGGIAAGLTKGIGDLESKLKEQIATFGMSSSQVEIWKLTQQGATAAQLANVSSMSAQIKSLEDDKKAHEDLVSKAKSIIEETRSPFEKYGEKLKELQSLKEQGLIDDKTFAAAKDKAGGDLDKGGARGAAALDRNSNEARSLILANASSGSSNDPIKDVAKTNKSQLAQATSQTDILGKILAKIGGGAGELFAIG